MNGNQEHGSEVARLLKEIREEFESAQQALSGLAYGTSQHAFITRRMENMGQLHDELGAIVGKEPAIAMIAEQLDACSDTTSSPDQ